MPVSEPFWIPSLHVPLSVLPPVSADELPVSAVVPVPVSGEPDPPPESARAADPRVSDVVPDAGVVVVPVSGFPAPAVPVSAEASGSA